jgi:prepilin-type N-terminal cleavage/methylation domain-containing protein
MSKSRGFTLIELMVSLTAGLTVALAVVGLSTEATNVFHEEARTAAAEMSLRTAVARMQADFQRAGFMGTGNIQTDPFIAHAPGSPNMVKSGTYNALYRLAGIHLYYQGSLATTPLSSTQGVAPPIAPDMVELSGNYTTTDSYVVLYTQAGSSVCGGTRLWLATDSPAMWRILSQTNPSAALEAAFQPVSGSPFLTRIADNTGHYQYLPTCVGLAAGVTGSGMAASAWVDLDTSVLTLLTAQATKTNGGSSGLGVGSLHVNPIQTVRWALRPINISNTGDAPYAELVSPLNDKYELFRTYVDATGTVTQQPELVSEYAVDLKIGFSADIGPATSLARSLTVYGLSDVGNQTIADDITVDALAMPQRVRSVHFRLATRSSVSDRSETFSLPAANAQQATYPTRYCVLNACTPGQVGWARMRTVTTEVSTQNLAKFFY